MTSRRPARIYRVADLVADLDARRRAAVPAVTVASAVPGVPAVTAAPARWPGSAGSAAERTVPSGTPAVPPPPPEPLPPPPSAPAAAELPPEPGQGEVRPTIAPEPAILGLSRHARSRLGSRLFVWFFVLVYAVILIQLVVTLWQDT